VLQLSKKPVRLTTGNIKGLPIGGHGSRRRFSAGGVVGCPCLFRSCFFGVKNNSFAVKK